MPPIILPDHPRQTEFEEFVSAILQCSGAFVERQIKERERRDVLELDVVITYLNEDQNFVRIVEVKSGDWGCEDLFKLAGWMQYLDVSEAILAVLGDHKDREVMDAVAARLGIRLAWIQSHDEAVEALRPFLVDCRVGDLDLGLWRYSYWLERCLGKRLSTLKKTIGSSRKAPARVYDVHRDLQTDLFARDLLTRTAALYETFGREPYLAARWGFESAGGDFDAEPRGIPSEVFKRVYHDREGSPHDLDLATWTEHRMRLAILKNLVEYELLRRSSGEEFNRVVFRLMGREYRLVDTLPGSFQTALSELRDHPYFHRYPVLWQWFLWVFGGFLLLGRLEDEYRWLGEKAGVPADEVPRALTCYDILFPTDGGWFRDLTPSSEIRVLTLMPVPYMGIGANLRRLRYAPDQEFEGLSLSGKYTLSDLARWNNNLVAYLRRCMMQSAGSG